MSDTQYITCDNANESLEDLIRSLVRTDGTSNYLATGSSALMLRPAFLSDTESQGIKMVLTAAQDTTLGDVCYIDATGEAAFADATTIATGGAVLIAAETIDHNSDGTFLFTGIICNAAWNWTRGGYLYLSLTAGGLTQTPPVATDEVIQILGVALTETKVFFFPNLMQIENV